jgi:glycosyltransferase involved in cell wall biosynthesis
MARTVLLVTVASERGGAEAVIEMIAARLDPRRFRPVLATPEGGALAEFWRAQGFEVVGTPPVARLARLDQQRHVIQFLSTVMRTQDVHLVHSHGVTAQIQSGRAARRAGVPVICHSHDVFDATWSIDGLLHRAAARTPRAHTVVVSEAVAASLRGRVPRAEMTVLPNGVLPELVAPADARPEGPLIVWCGRLQRWKGAHLFLEMARLVSQARPDVRFVIVGDAMFGMEPEYPGEVRRLATGLGISSVVTFAGHVSDARPWLAAADVVVHSSTRPDPFPLVVLESMMQGRVVVAFDRGGPAEALDATCGRLVAPDDVPAMAHAVLDVLGDAAGRDALAAGARMRALSLYSVDAMVRRIEVLYEAVDKPRVRT